MIVDTFGPEDPAEKVREAAIACIEAVLSDGTEPERYATWYAAALELLRTGQVIVVNAIDALDGES